MIPSQDKVFHAKTSAYVTEKETSEVSKLSFKKNVFAFYFLFSLGTESQE